VKERFASLEERMNIRKANTLTQNRDTLIFQVAHLTSLIEVVDKDAVDVEDRINLVIS
jgi:hypothetical protein